MKRLLMIAIATVGLMTTVDAQTKSKTTKAATKATPSKKKAAPAKKAKDSTITLLDSSASAAYNTRLQIADPTINAMNYNAAGGNIKLSSSGVAGMPKGTYGFANGRIFLRSTLSTSSGTSYGSGSVGTGTTLHGLGTSERSIGVNGKSPYAGNWLWGSKRPVYSVALSTDSTSNR